MSIGAMPTAWGLKQPRDAESLMWWYQEYTMYSSDHNQLVQFCWGDGSVHGLDESVDDRLYIFVSGMRDGMIIDTEHLGF
jgi:hypothetical protein